MILGILPEQGGSIAGLARTGQDGRFVHSYLGAYAQSFEKVYYFSYADEHPVVPENCTVIANPGYHRWAYAFLLPLVQRRRFLECDVLRVMQAYGAIPAMIAKLVFRRPFVATYGYPYFEPVATAESRLRAYLFLWRANLAAYLADRVIVTTDEMASYVLRWVPRAHILLVPNGVDTSLFRPAEARVQRSEKVIICVGRLSPQKNLNLLIDALSLIDKVEAKLVLVGDGDLRGELEAHARETKVHVEFRGVLPNQEVPGILAHADVFVLPSSWEGHPKALLEAMSCGLPCVGTNVLGIREVVHHMENGLLCEVTKEDLASKISQILSNPELAARLGRQARASIVKDLDLGVLLAREIEAMRSLA
jgi:glycosyltransferase involved in cell wall biosynthesis